MLKGKNINLRTIKESDLPQLLYLSNEISERGEYYPIRLESEPLQREKFIKTGYWEERGGRLLITDKQDSILGYMGFFEAIGYPAAIEIGAVLFDPKNWRQGYITEAAILFIIYLFELKPINRVQACAFAGNSASTGAMEKLGFHYEGTLRETIFHRGHYVDLVVYSLLRSEVDKLKELYHKLYSEK